MAGLDPDVRLADSNSGRERSQLGGSISQSKLSLTPFSLHSSKLIVADQECPAHNKPIASYKPISSWALDSGEPYPPIILAVRADCFSSNRLRRSRCHRAISSSCFKLLVVQLIFFFCLQGKHPEHKGCCDLERLGPVERWFATIMGLPRLKQRLQCAIAVRTFDETAGFVSRPPPPPPKPGYPVSIFPLL